MIRRPKISESALCLLYRQGQPRDAIVVRAGIPDYAVVAILVRNGIPLRNDAEARLLAIQNRERWKSTERSRLLQRKIRRRKPKDEVA